MHARSRLDLVDDRFHIPLEIVEGGSGRFMGTIDEPNQAAPAAYVFSRPRRMLRVDFFSDIRPGYVIRTGLGQEFMVGSHGGSEMRGGTFKSFRLFEVTGTMQWSRRVPTINPVTHLPEEDLLESLGVVRVVYEPEQREAFDRQFRASFETAKVLTTQPALRDDLLDEMKVTRTEPTLGLWMLSLA